MDIKLTMCSTGITRYTELIFKECQLPHLITRVINICDSELQLII